MISNIIYTLIMKKQEYPGTRTENYSVELCPESKLSVDDVRRLINNAISVSDKQTFYNIYDEIHKNATYSGQHIKLIEKVFSEFDDKKRSSQMCDDILDDTDWNLAHEEIARIVFELFGDQKRAISICKNLEPKLSYSEDLLSLSETVYDLFKDSEWVSGIVDKALNCQPDLFCYVNAAELAMKVENSKVNAIKYFKSALKIAESAFEIAYVGKVILQDYKDEEWAKNIMEKAVLKIEDITDLLMVCDCIISPEILNDREWAIRVINANEELIRNDNDEIMVNEFQNFMDENNIKLVQLKV